MTNQSKVTLVEAQAVPDLPVATITKDEALSALADVYLALPFGSASRVTLVRRFIEQSRPTAAADLHQQIINLPCNAPDLRTRADVRQAYAEGHRDARHAAAQLVAASPAAAADLDLFNEACAILSAVMSYELPTELKHRIVNVLCTDASPVAPVGAPTRQHSVHLAVNDAGQDFRGGSALPAAASRGWQPIETAPTDGTWVQLFGEHPRTNCQQMSARWCGGEWESGDDGYRPYINPTHWMPLPPPPGLNGSPGGTDDGQVNKETLRALLSRPGCELATDATKQLGEPSPLPLVLGAFAQDALDFVHLAATPIEQDFRRRPASSEAAPKQSESHFVHLAMSTSSVPTAAPLLSSRETDRSALPLLLRIDQDAESGWWKIEGPLGSGLLIAHPSLDVCMADILPSWRGMAKLSPSQVPPVPPAVAVPKEQARA